MTLGLKVLLLLVLAGTAVADADRNRMVVGALPSVSATIKASASVHRGGAPHETWHATVRPQISADMTFNSRWIVWLGLPAVAEIGASERGGMSGVVGIGDLRAGAGYMGSLGAFTYRLSAGLSMPTGVGGPYAFRVARYTSGSGEYLFHTAVGLAYVSDPVAVRIQNELTFRPADIKWTSIALEQTQLAVSALLLLNRRFTLEWGLGLLAILDPVARRVARIPEPILGGKMGLAWMFENLSASLSISSGLWPALADAAIGASVGMSWRRE